jgi:hypothetical protein
MLDFVQHYDFPVPRAFQKEYNLRYLLAGKS